MMVATPTNFTVADYCAAMDRNEIIVNKKYQRSDKIWPSAARSFLIESILLGYPIPKIYLHSITDLKTRKTIKEIVDGQQRSRAIYDFFSDKYSLSRNLETEEIRGLTYSELPEKWQGRFVTYSISADLFLSADEDYVRQIFRRMNSYTVPLNPEELRHAEYQGQFKWFVYNFSRKYEQRLSNIGAFNEKAFVRMQDLKLMTEIVHAIDNGITTTNNKILTGVYKKYNDSFPTEKKIEECLTFAFDKICEMDFLKGSNIAKPHMIYSLALALIDTKSPIPSLDPPDDTISFRSETVEERILELSAALDLDEDEAKNSKFRTFIAASSEKTNVKAQRETRVRWFIQALRGSQV